MAEPSSMGGGFSGRVGQALTWKTIQLGGDRIISLVRFLILARLLAPEDFGLLAIATVAHDLMLTVTNFGMVPALIQRRDAEARHYHAAWTVNLLRGVGVAIVVAVAAPLIARLFGDPRATSLIALIALRPLLTGLKSIRVADLERDLDFKALAQLEIPASVINTIVAIALVPVMGVYALIAGMLAGAVVQVGASYLLAPYRPHLTLSREAASPLFRYGRWILASSLVGVAGEAALRVVIARGLGTAELGLYYLAARLVSLPNGVISTILGAVTFPLHVQLQERADRAAEALRSNMTALLATLVPVYVTLILLAPALIRDVLGERWEGAGPAIMVLSLAPMLGIVFDAVEPLMQGRGSPQRITLLMALRSVVLLIVVWPLSVAFGLVGAAAAVIVAEIPTQVLAARLASRELPRPFHGLWPALLASFGAALVAGAAAAGVDAVIGPPLGLFAAAATAAVVGLVLLAGLDRVVGVGLFAQLVRALPVLGRLPLLRHLTRPR